jgi:hypothetical protein
LSPFEQGKENNITGVLTVSNDVLGTKCLIHEKFFVIYFFRGKFAFSRRRHEQAQKKRLPRVPKESPASCIIGF